MRRPRGATRRPGRSCGRRDIERYKQGNVSRIRSRLAATCRGSSATLPEHARCYNDAARDPATGSQQQLRGEATKPQKARRMENPRNPRILRSLRAFWWLDVPDREAGRPGRSLARPFRRGGRSAFIDPRCSPKTLQESSRRRSMRGSAGGGSFPTRSCAIRTRRRSPARSGAVAFIQRSPRRKRACSPSSPM